MNPRIILKQPQRNTMNRRIPPPFIKETTRLIQMLKILLILLRPPKVKISNLEIRPEMARAIPVRGVGVLRPQSAVCEPHERVVSRQIIRMRFEERLGLGPQRGDGAGVVEDVDCEAVGFVVVGHELEGVVGYVAEESTLHQSLIYRGRGGKAHLTSGSTRQ